MKKKSRHNSMYALVALAIFAIILYFVARSIFISADKSDSFYFSNPLKVGENVFVTSRPVDLSQRIIGINGSLLTIEEAKRRGVIQGVFSENGNQLTENNLLSADSSFIINVQDISASPALYLEGIK